MREVIVRVTCDACPRDAPLDAQFVVRVDLGGGLRESDLCAEHAAAFATAVGPFVGESRAIAASGRCRRR
jgi:hypothetical protein